MRELISAIATASGRGGIAIIRVSGEGALELARKMFSRKGEFVPNVLYPGKIDCGSFCDFGMCVYFRAPHSFTGEDVIEFHVHGGTEIARGALKATFLHGARQAEAGEFTRRAFLNGKLSLSAAEGLGEMIGAESSAQVRAGYLLYGEKLTQEGMRMQALIRECLAETDADVDYPEEDLSIDVGKNVTARTMEIENALTELLSHYRAGRKIKAGVNVAICGRPNAGKSSLLNALLGYEKAIVSNIPGTTRDLVEGSLEIGGVLFHLTDSAGLRESGDLVEREGIRRAEQVMRGADVIVYLSEEEEVSLPDGIPVIRVGAKCDLVRRSGCDVLVSSVTGEGIEALKELLYARGFGKENDGAFLLEERHYAALSEALEEVRAAQKAVLAGLPAELYAENLKSAYTALGRISGETASEDIINEIFGKFCVGK